VNFGFWNPDDSCPEDQDSNCTVEQKRANANGFFSDQIPGNLFGTTPSYACQLNATVDGIPVQDMGFPIVRTQSPVFPLGAVDDPETISDGYWVALPPLENGEHTIMFTGGLCYFNFADIPEDPEDPQDPEDIAGAASPPIFLVDLTYEITVGGGRH
jgi:hypothetical protein